MVSVSDIMEWEPRQASALLVDDSAKAAPVLGLDEHASDALFDRADRLVGATIGRREAEEVAGNGRWSFTKQAWKRIERAAEARRLLSAKEAAGAPGVPWSPKGTESAQTPPSGKTAGAPGGIGALARAVGSSLDAGNADGRQEDSPSPPDLAYPLARKGRNPGERPMAAARAPTAAGTRSATAGGEGRTAGRGQQLARKTFSERQAERNVRRSVWREQVTRRRAAKSAIAAAKAKQEEAVAAKAAAKAASAPAKPVAAPLGAVAAGALLAMLAVGAIAALTTSLLMTVTAMEQEQGGSGGQALAEVALAEYASGPHSGGQRYWSHVGFGGRVEWCSCFVKYCWDKCGFDKELGGPGRNVGMANSWIIWASQNGDKAQMMKMSTSYKPQPGDILVIGSLTVSTHVGICVSEADEVGRYTCVEGNYGDAVAKTTYFAGQTWNYVCRPKYPASAGGIGGGQRSGGGIDFGSGANFREPQSEFVKKWAPRIKAFYAAAGCAGVPLAAESEEMARAAWRNKIDPRLVPSLSILESTGGRYCYEKYNAWGWGAADSGYAYHTLESWAEGIEMVSSGIARGYQDVGSVAAFDNRYCPGRGDRGSLLDMMRKFK